MLSSGNLPRLRTTVITAVSGNPGQRVKLGSPEITGQWGEGQGPGRSVSTLPWGSRSTGVIQARRLWRRWEEVSMVTTRTEGSELAPSFTLVRLGGERWCWVLELGSGSAGPRQGPFHSTLDRSAVCQASMEPCLSLPCPSTCFSHQQS